METHNQHIELINNYRNNLLSKEARVNFEYKLKTDIEFNARYEEQFIFVNGLDRVQIKDDILKGKRAYHIEKWLKISGISIITLGALIVLYTLIFNTSERKPAAQNDNLNTIISDSTSTQKPTTENVLDISEDKDIENKSEIEERYTTTTINEKYGSVTTTYAELKKQAQVIRINTQNDTIIRCKEGTILKIAKGSFINPKTKKTITGLIDLKVTEYYKLSDILMANLSTVSNGKQLETGGMLYVEAKQGNTKLELNNNTPMEISFPNKNQKTGMELFSGEWKDENINWNLQSDELEVLDIPISEEIIEVPFSVVEQVPTFPGCEDDNNEVRKKCTQDAISKFISRNFNPGVGLGLGLTGLQRINCYFKIDQQGYIIFIRSRAAHPRISEEADRVLGLLPKMIPGMQRGRPVVVPYSLPIRFEVEGGQDSARRFGTETRTTNTIIGGITDSIMMTDEVIRGIEMDTVSYTTRGIVESIREVMHDKDFPVDSLFINEWRQYKKQKLIRNYGVNEAKRFLLRKPLFEMADTKFKILEDDSITRGGHVIRIPWDETKIPTTTRVINIVPKQRFAAGTVAVTAEEFEARLIGETDTSISSRDVSYYMLRTSNLGWLNCDRFINGRTKRIKYKLKIKNADGANINMVFKSLNSVLPSWYTNGVYDFQTVGANEDVIIVAIKRKDGKLYLSTIETKTESNPQLDFDFREVTLDEMKLELEALNEVFD